MASGKPTHLLVTGASGLLGANFVVEACQLGRRLTGVSHSRKFVWPGCECLCADLTDAAAAHSLLDQVNPSVIVHLAAATNVDECEADPGMARRLNVEATGYLADWAAMSGVKLVYMSTDAVFDGKRGGYLESDVTGPQNWYARSKLEGEDRVTKGSAGNLVIRANIFGWNAYPKTNLAEWILSKLEAGQSISGYNDSVFAPLLVNTLAQMILQLIDAGASGVVHLACAEPLSKLEFAHRLARRFGLSEALIIPAETQQGSGRAPRPLNTWITGARAAKEFGLAAPSIDAEIDRFYRIRSEGLLHRLRQAAQ